jgi:hypothetical protein
MSIETSPNTYTFPKKTAAVALIAASAFSLAGCNTSGAANHGAYVECVGSQPYTVKPGDTLNKVLLDHTTGVTEGTVNDISATLGQTDEFKGPGALPRLEVFHWTDGTLKPGLDAGEEVDIPLQCTN